MKLHQDKQFVPTQEDVILLLTEYGLVLAGYELADSGIENCTIITNTASGKYVLRIYRQYKKNDDDIQAELDFVTYLGENNIPVALPIANLKGDLISHVEQRGYVWQAILMRHIQGSHPDHYSNGTLLSLATIQARMHNLATTYKSGKILGKRLGELRETQFIEMIKNREAIDLRQQAFIDRAENYVVKLNDSLPGGLCHLDFDNENVLCIDNTVTGVLDFDDLTNAPYVICLAYTLWDIVYDLGFDVIDIYVTAYEKIRSLNENEKTFIKPVMLFRHYAIGCLDIANSRMDEPTFTKYLELENRLLSALPTAP